MSKPREFWIIGEEVYGCEQIPDPVSFHAEQMHVREVLPIDWERLWQEWSDLHEPYETGRDLIQELVEKALKGEL